MARSPSAPYELESTNESVGPKILTQHAALASLAQKNPQSRGDSSIQRSNLSSHHPRRAPFDFSERRLSARRDIAKRREEQQQEEEEESGVT